MSTLPDPEGRKLLRIEVRNSQTPIEKKPEWIRTTAKPARTTRTCARSRTPKACTLCAPRRAAPTSTSAGRTARRPSCSVVPVHASLRLLRHCDGRPTEYDKDEPRRIAESVRDLDLRYVTITGVTRDDLPDGAAWLYAETCRLIHELNPGTGVELLVTTSAARQSRSTW